MSGVVSALDSFTPEQYGENGNLEYGRSMDFQEKILQLSFQLVRTNNNMQLERLKNTFKELFVRCENGENDVLFKLLLHTRDIVNGKGEYNLFYELLMGLIEVTTEIGVYSEEYVSKINKVVSAAINSLVYSAGGGLPYGSWKDLKYICNKIRERFPKRDVREIDAFNVIIGIYVEQLKRDSEGGKNISLVGRWAPRERSNKFGWISSYISRALYPEWIITAKTSKSKRDAHKKCQKHYRELVTSLNSELNTVQVKQCEGNWGDIDFYKEVTSITMSRQRKAFLNVDKCGKSRGFDWDRQICAGNFRGYIDECNTGKHAIRASRVGLIDMIKDAVGFSRYSSTILAAEKMALNLQWEENGKVLSVLENLVAMVDTSGSMEGENCNPLYSAIGLGLRVAENSKLGKRVLTFSKEPRWIDLDKYDNLTDMAKRLREDKSWGMNTDFRKAMKLVADACVAKNLEASEVEKLVLVVFTDMQIDMADKNVGNDVVMSEYVDNLFDEAGRRSKRGQPYKSPHMVYWNLRSGDGYPALSTKKNISMLSGSSQILLNGFCEKGVEFLRECTPWTILMDQLGHERYRWTSDLFESLFKEKEDMEDELISDAVVIDKDPEFVEEVVEVVEKGGWFW